MFIVSWMTSASGHLRKKSTLVIQVFIPSVISALSAGDICCSKAVCASTCEDARRYLKYSRSRMHKSWSHLPSLRKALSSPMSL